MYHPCVKDKCLFSTICVIASFKQIDKRSEIQNNKHRRVMSEWFPCGKYHMRRMLMNLYYNTTISFQGTTTVWCKHYCSTVICWGFIAMIAKWSLLSWRCQGLLQLLHSVLHLNNDVFVVQSSSRLYNCALPGEK